MSLGGFGDFDGTKGFVPIGGETQLFGFVKLAAVQLSEVAVGGIRIGDNVSADVGLAATNTTVIGNDTTADGINNFIAGLGASDGGFDSVVCIGEGAACGADNTIAIGKDTIAGSSSGHTETIVIGRGSQALETDCVVMGDTAIANSIRNTIIGTNATTTDVECDDAVIIGTDSDATMTKRPIIIGSNNHTEGFDTFGGANIVIAYSKNVIGAQNVSLGSNIANGSTSDADRAFDCLAMMSNGNIGKNVHHSMGIHGTVTPFDGVTRIEESMAVGYLAYTSYDECVAIGARADVKWGPYGVAIGVQSDAVEGAISIGYQSTTGDFSSDKYAIAIGYQTACYGNNSISIGKGNGPIGFSYDDTVSLGSGLTVSADNECIIGASTNRYIFDGRFNDNSSIDFGTGRDSSIYYDGTDLIVDAAVSGTGVINTNGSGFEGTYAALGGDSVGTIAYLEMKSLSSATTLALLFGQITHEGTGITMGSFQTDATMGASASATNQTAYGGSFRSFSSRASGGVHSAIGVNSAAGFTDNTISSSAWSAFYGGINTVLGASFIGDGTHTGNISAFGLYIPAFGAAVTSGTYYKHGIFSFEDVNLADDVKLGFDAGTIAAATTYLVYDSASTSLDGYVDSSQWIGVDLTTDNHVDLSFQDVRFDSIALGGGNVNASAYIDLDQSGSKRGALNFLYEATSGTISANINNQLTLSTDQSTSYSQNTGFTANVDGAGTNNYYAHNVDVGFDSALVLTSGVGGTYNTYGIRVRNTLGNGNASSTGGTVNYCALRLPAFNDMLGSTTTNSWSGFVDTGGYFQFGDDSILAFGGTFGGTPAHDGSIQSDGTDIVFKYGGSKTTYMKLSTNGVEVPGDVEIYGGQRMYLDAGDTGNRTADAYLDYNNGTLMSANNGYCMMRAGAVTGISVSYQVSIATTPGDVIFEVRKNGTALYTLTETVSTTGDKNASQTQTRAVAKAAADTFAADDVITMFCNFNGFAGTIHDTAMVVELTVDT